VQSLCYSISVDSICDPPLVTSFYLSRDVASAHSAVRLSPLLVRRSGTHWQTNCELTLVIGSNRLWRLFSATY